MQRHRAAVTHLVKFCKGSSREMGLYILDIPLAVFFPLYAALQAYLFVFSSGEHITKKESPCKAEWT